MYLPTYSPVHNWRNAKNKNNLYKIHIRVHIKGNDRYYEVEIPQKIRPQDWSGKDKSWVKNVHPFAFEINQKIKEKLDILNNLVKRYYNANKTLSFEIIARELLKGNNTNSFIAYFEEYIKNPRETVEEITLNRYRACLSSLKEFNPNITFSDLSDSIFQDFKKFLEKSLLGSTINGYFNAAKIVVKWARKDNHITREHEKSIFEDVHISINKPKSDFLEVEEVLEWINYEFAAKYKKYERDRDMFQLLVYTGYYYNDLKGLLKSELRKDPEYGYYFYSERFKNDNLAIVPLWKFPKALAIIERYRDQDPESPYLFIRDTFIESQAFNRNLKVIAGPKMLNWKRDLFNKLGRKTNAQLYIRFGAKRPVVSKMMGHGKEETTSAYFDVNIKEVIEGTKEVDFTKHGL